MRYEIDVTVVVVVLLLALFACAALASFVTCQSQTAAIGFESRWNPVAGCMIEVQPDQWIPLDRYYFKQE